LELSLQLEWTKELESSSTYWHTMKDGWYVDRKHFFIFLLGLHVHVGWLIALSGCSVELVSLVRFFSNNRGKHENFTWMMSMILVVGYLIKFYKFMPRQNNVSENNYVSNLVLLLLLHLDGRFCLSSYSKYIFFTFFSFLISNMRTMREWRLKKTWINNTFSTQS
jgi:hypothetical protein